VKKRENRIFIDPFDDLGYAKVDLHREVRKGFPEVVFCAGKTPLQVTAITRKIYKANKKAMLTHVLPTVARRLKKSFPRGRYHKAAHIFYIGTKPKQTGLICVLSAGTADIPVAEEAAVTAEILGSRVKRIYDVGVAGIHRLLAFRKDIERARVLVVVAGMDGVLASVVGGLFAKPIIATPTSVGYGFNLKGVAPLLTMLNSCAPGIAVVNIDNGFGAGYIAALINKI